MGFARAHFAGAVFAGCLAAVLLYSIAAPAQEAKPPECAKVGVMAKRLMQEKKLAYLADAIDSKDLVHMWYMNKKTGRWAELEVDEDLNACLVREGYDWHFAAAK